MTVEMIDVSAMEGTSIVDPGTTITEVFLSAARDNTEVVLSSRILFFLFDTSHKLFYVL